MYVTLSNGQEIRIHFSHKTFKTKLGERRGTEIKLVTDGRTFKVKAICAPNDNFSKKLGRKFAAQKLLDRTRTPLVGVKSKLTTNVLYFLLQNKMDHAKVFYAINPNLISKPKKKRKSQS